jgi:hypothetical protein
MKMLTVGCSWSSGYGIDPNDAYPRVLESLIPDCKVINLAAPGTSFTHAIHNIIGGIEEHNPDVVLFQGTTLDRVTFGVNGYNNFLKEVYLPHDRVFLHITQEVLLKATDNDKKYFLSLAKDIKYSGNIEELISAVKFYGLHTMYDHFTLDSYMISLATLQSHLNQKKIKHLFFPYLHFTWEGRKYFNIWDTKFGNLPNTNNIIRQPFETWLSKYTDNNHYIDNGFHLDKEGHKLLAKEYLLPKLKKIINEN